MKTESHKERAHSIMGGSRAEIYSNCTGYFSIIKGLPEQESSSAADEGTLFHEVMEKITENYLQHKLHGTESDLSLYLQDKKISDEMKAHADDCLEVLWERGLEKFLTGKAYGLEEYFSMATVGDINIGGPVDFWCVYKDKKGLRAGLIVDWKYGYTYVDEEKAAKYQLGHYATSLYEELKRLGKSLDYVRVAIVQPRAGGHLWREVKFNADKLEAKKQRFLRIANDVFIHKKIKFKAGTHCQWCPGKGSCKTHEKYVQEKSGLELIRKDTEFPKVETLSDEQRVKLLTYKDEITDFLKAVYSDTLRRIKQTGKPIAGLKVVEGTSKRKWKDKTEEIGKGLINNGVKEPYRPVETELRTITDIEKELKKLVGNEEDAKRILEDYTEKGTVPEILVPLSDNRPQVKSYTDLLK